MIETFFFDSYALFEIIRGNNNYSKYLNVNIIITKLNLFELYYGLLKDVGEKIASTILDKYIEFAVDFDRDIIKQAAKFRLMYNKYKLSMTDCIGYTTATKLGIKFLTGDMQFENLPNVEFVK